MNGRSILRQVVLAALVAAMTNVEGRVVSLDGLWDFRLERDKTLEEVPMPGFAADAKMTVPGAWDATSRYYNQSGTGCYRMHFELKEAVTNAFLIVDGSCLRSRYWLDGREIGFSKLPWSRLEFATGPLAAGTHELVAAVDNVVDNAKVKLFWDFYDFYPSGGFQHGVSLELQEKEVEIRKVIVRTRDYRTGLVDLEVAYAAKGPADFTAEVSFDGGQARTVAFKGRHAQLDVPAFRLWTPETPNLHVVSVNGVRARFGIRQVGVASGRITLNGRPVYLKGFNRHEAHYELGSSTPVQIMYEDISNLKDLGGNFIRGAHYAQCEKFLDLCDEMGVLVWEESLGWGNVARQIQDPEFRALQEEETRLMVRNSINHPSIVISAFLNEPDSFMPECKTLVERLIDVVKAEDTGHLVTFACHRTKNDISHEKTDIIAVNLYPGWYSHIPVSGTHDEMRQSLATCYDETIAYFRKKYGDDRPILISESGVKSDYGARDSRGKAQMTEDFQDEYERLMLEEVFARRDFAGIAIWQLTDAKTYTRKTAGLRGRSYGVNTGGVYDLYRRPKLVVDTIRELYRGRPAYEDRTDTSALQARIDAVSAAGGGTVCVTGEWTVASLKLKSGVTLRLEEDARLLASTNHADYANTPGENRGAVVCAEDAERIAIEGPGVIDGRGGCVPRVRRIPGRWRGVVFTRCKDVRIEDVTIRNAHSWGCYLKECDGVVVRRLKVSNHVNHNNDGLDIASRNVLVEDCDIDSEDDGLVFKNPNPDFVVEHVRVRNCRISSNTSFIKIGTETFGGFRDIDIRDCELDTRVPISVRSNYLGSFGVTTLHTGTEGVSVEMVDGGFVDGVTVSGMRMKRGIRVPVFVRLDKRTPRTDGVASYLRNVLIENVTMEEPTTSWIASSITGGSGLRPSNVTLRNCVFRPKACPQVDVAKQAVPEMDGMYPSGKMFCAPLPACGLYVRHADAVLVKDVRILPAGEDPRPLIVYDDSGHDAPACGQGR